MARRFSNTEEPLCKKKDRRSVYTEGVIKDAFLEELEAKPYGSITISSLCKRAEITRPTFYAHYPNLSSVLDSAIADAVAEIGDVPLSMCRKCGKGLVGLDAETEEDKHPFCEMVLGRGHFTALFNDDSIASRVVDGLINDAARAQLVAGAREDVVRKTMAVNLFRMNGCMAAAKSFRRLGMDWKHARPVIDRFVAAGLEEVIDT